MLVVISLLLASASDGFFEKKFNLNNNVGTAHVYRSGEYFGFRQYTLDDDNGVCIIMPDKEIIRKKLCLKSKYYELKLGNINIFDEKEKLYDLLGKSDEGVLVDYFYAKSSIYADRYNIGMSKSIGLWDFEYRVTKGLDDSAIISNIYYINEDNPGRMRIGKNLPGTNGVNGVSFSNNNFINRKEISFDKYIVNTAEYKVIAYKKDSTSKEISVDEMKTYNKDEFEYIDIVNNNGDTKRYYMSRHELSNVIGEGDFNYNLIIGEKRSSIVLDTDFRYGINNNLSVSYLHQSSGYREGIREGSLAFRRGDLFGEISYNLKTNGFNIRSKYNPFKYFYTAASFNLSNGDYRVGMGFSKDRLNVKLQFNHSTKKSTMLNISKAFSNNNLLSAYWNKFDNDDKFGISLRVPFGSRSSFRVSDENITLQTRYDDVMVNTGIDKDENFKIQTSYNGDISLLSQMQAGDKNFEYYRASGSALVSDEGVFYSGLPSSNNPVYYLRVKGLDEDSVAVVKFNQNKIIVKEGEYVALYAKPFEKNSVELIPGSISKTKEIIKSYYYFYPKNTSSEIIELELADSFNVILKIHYKGKPIPQGSLVNIERTNVTALSQQRGKVLFKNISSGDKGTVELKDGYCSFSLDINNNILHCE